MIGRAAPVDELLGVATDAVLRQLPAGVIVARSDGTIALATERVGEIVGDLADLSRSTEAYAALRWFRPDGTRLDPAAWPLARALRDGEAVAGEEVTLVRGDGRPVLVRASATPIVDARGDVVAAVGILADISGERDAREARTFLADAGALLGSSLDVDEIAVGLAKLAVPRIADWCSVELLEDDGAFRQAGLAHSDPEHLELARELRLRRPPEPDDPAGLHAVLRAGRPILASEIPAEALADPRLDDRERELVRALALRSLLMIPLLVAGEAVGVLTLVTAESGRRLGPEDEELGVALASRAAAAIQNARLVDDLREFKAVLDATQEGILIVDGATRLVGYANHAAGELFGRNPRELVGLAVEEVAGTAVRSIRAAFRAVVARPGAARRLTLRVRSDDGRHPVELLLHGMPRAGTSGLVVGIARDISERIEAAERMRRLVVAQHARAAELGAVIRAIGEGLVLVAADGRIRLVNPAADHLLPGLEGATWTNLVGRLEDGPENLPAHPAPGPPVELRRRGPDDCWLEVACYPIPAAQGTRSEDAGTIVVVRDVTEAHQRALVRDTFLGVLSHELRTPVTTIYGAAAILARDPSGAAPGRAELFTDIVEESERLQRIVENVIALTRFGDAPGDLGREPVLLQRILPAAIKAERARWPGVEFVLDLTPGMPTVAADPVYLEQVVRNLLGNAAKYAGAGGPIRVEVRPTSDEVVVTVLDRGPGLAAGESDRVFDLYYRSAETAGQAAGAGIGLFVCARLIGAMGGRIWGRPRLGGGAEFGFALRVMGDD